MSTASGESAHPDSPLWADAEIVLRIRHCDSGTSQIYEFQQPFLRIGRGPRSDIRIVDPCFNSRHLYFHIDPRGVFGVDLVGRPETQFPGSPQPSGWLESGEGLDVGGYRIDLLYQRANHLEKSVFDESTRRPLLEKSTHSSPRARLSLEPIGVDDRPDTHHRIRSELAFIGRRPSSAYHLDDPSVSQVHCAIFRTAEAAYVINLTERLTAIDERPIAGASKIFDQQVLSLGDIPHRIHLTQPELRPVAATVEPQDPPTTLPAVAIEPTAPAVSDPQRAELLQMQAVMRWMLGHMQSNQEAMDRRYQELEGSLTNQIQEFKNDHLKKLQQNLDQFRSIQRELSQVRKAIVQIRRGQLQRASASPDRTESRRDPAAQAWLEKARREAAEANKQAGTEESLAWLIHKASELEAQGQTQLNGALSEIDQIRPR